MTMLKTRTCTLSLLVMLLLQRSLPAACRALEGIRKKEDTVVEKLDIPSPREQAGRWLQNSERDEEVGLAITTIDATTTVITGDVNWSMEETPIVHVVGKKRLFIEEGSSLTITEGVIVRFESIKSGIRNNGLLRILGTPNKRVVMEPLEGGDDFWQGVVFGKKAVNARYTRRGSEDSLQFSDGSVLQHVDMINVWSRDTVAVDALACLYFDEGKVPFLDGVRLLGCEGIGVNVRAYNKGRFPILMRNVVISQPTDLRRGITILDVKGPVVLHNVRIEREKRSKGGYGRSQKSHSDGQPALNLRNVGNIEIHNSTISGGYMKWRKVNKARFTDNSISALPGTTVAVLQATRLPTPRRIPEREIYIANNTFMGGRGVTFGREGGLVTFYNNTIGAEKGENSFCRGLQLEGYVGPVNVTQNVFLGGQGRIQNGDKPSLPAVIHVAKSNVNFTDNVIRDCTAPGPLFLLSGNKVGGKPTRSLIGGNLVENVDAPVETAAGESTLLEVKSTNFVVTNNIFDQEDFRLLVDVSGISEGSDDENGATFFEMPANYWGDADTQDDLTSGQRSTVLDSLSQGQQGPQGQGVIVDFVTLKTKPTLSSPLIKVPLPNEDE